MLLHALDDESDYLSGAQSGDVIIGPNGMLIETNSLPLAYPRLWVAKVESSGGERVY